MDSTERGGSLLLTADIVKQFDGGPRVEAENATIAAAATKLRRRITFGCSVGAVFWSGVAESTDVMPGESWSLSGALR